MPIINVIQFLYANSNFAFSKLAVLTKQCIDCQDSTEDRDEPKWIQERTSTWREKIELEHLNVGKYN